VKSPRWMRAKMPLRRGPWRIVMLVVLFAAAAIVAALVEPLPPALNGQARVSDGDTLRIGNDRIRIVGLDAPELDQTCTDATGAAWQCGRESSQQLRELVGGGTVSCITEGRDQYGRYLGRCTVDGVDLGATLVAQGFAIASFPSYGAEEALARREKRGIWSGSFDTPRRWRDTHGDTATGFDLLGWIRSLFA
jgi:endonuclease YncB( thermonuclease family)